jgi:hypothetical protein
MKIRRIPDIDLARIAVQPTDNKRVALEQLKEGWPPHSLDPMREQIGDIVNLQMGLLGDRRPTPWSVIERAIVKRSRTSDEGLYNIAIARSLYNWCSAQDIVSYGKSVPAWSVGLGHSLSYWNQYYSVLGERATFMFVDPRLSAPLTEQARRFAFSIMHQRLRVDDPDFSDAQLLILQFRKGDAEGSRLLIPHQVDGLSLFARDELNEMIDETYLLWAEVLAGRQERARRTGTGGSDNPMNF